MHAVLLRCCILHRPARLKTVLVPCRGDGRQALGREVGAAVLRGQVSLRAWMVIAYLVVLHVLVMLSFSRHHDAYQAGGPNLPGS